MRRRPSAGSGDDDANLGPEDIGASVMRNGKKRKSRDGGADSDMARGFGVGDSVKESTRRPMTDSTWSTTTSVTAPSVEQHSLPGLAREKEDKAWTMANDNRQRARLRSPWSCSMLTLSTSICAILLLLTIAQSFLSLQLDPKGCAMSYMTPSFHRYDDFDTEHTRFASKYSLYLYRERNVDQDVRVKGIPVLFIPGNAGSYRQVRPIAAEAAHYFQDVLRTNGAMEDGKRTLDFFSVDFNEDITAFHGQTLLDQAEYLNEAIAYILALYTNPARSLREQGLPDPKSVIILGHSMGGVVGRQMLSMPNYQEHTINTIVTLSAPHARAPVSFDAEMVSIYNDMNTFWRRSFSKPIDQNPLSEVTIASIAGGGLDTMVPSEFTSLTSLVPDTHGFTVFTSAIPTVWTAMDHLAIMWCDQFRKALVKTLYDAVDVRRPSQTRSQADRIGAFRKRLLTGIEPVIEKSVLAQTPTTLLTLAHHSTNTLSMGERLNLRSLSEKRHVRAHAMPIPASSQVHEGKFTLLTDQQLHDGEGQAALDVLFCNTLSAHSNHHTLAISSHLDFSGGDTGMRLLCNNAAADAALLPSSKNNSINAFDVARPFTYLQYELADISQHDFVVVVDKTHERTSGWAIAEFSAKEENQIIVSKGHHEILLNGMDVVLPPQRPMMMELKIPEVHSTLFAYRFEVNRHPCDRLEERFHPLMRQYIAEPYESKYFVNAKQGNINVHGISPYMPPSLGRKGDSDGLSLQLWTDPICNSTVEVSLQVDLLGSAGKLVLRYRTVFAAFPLLVVAIVMRKQFKVYDATGVFMSFSESMDQCLRTSLPTVFVALTFLAISFSKASSHPWTHGWLSASSALSVNDIDFTANDLLLGSQDPFFWFLVPLFGLISVGVCIAFNYTILVVAHILAWAYAKARRLWLWNEDARSVACTFPTPNLNRRIATTSLLLLLVATVVPYQFAYLVLTLVQVFTSIRALNHASSEATTRTTPSPPGSTDTTLSGTGSAQNFYNLTHSVLILMLWVLPLNLPVLIVWLHNLGVHWLTPFSTHHNLLSVLPTILLVETTSTGAMVPRLDRSRLRHLTDGGLFGLALYAAIYGVSFAYRLHHCVNVLCGWLLLLHLLERPSIRSWLSPSRARPAAPTVAGGDHHQRSEKKRP
ncbi:hypothetical protein MBLNU230_g5145t1 [Neophaeotheca triangularis]